MKISALLAVAATMVAMPAMAVQVFSTGYDTPNGGGQASGGSYNYWDLAYSGSGSTNIDGAALSGGSGDLTDGVVANNSWYATEVSAGTGPYVGWYEPGLGGQRSPTVTFHFAGGTTITDINIHLDNVIYGGVESPIQILIDGINTPFVGPTPGTNGFVNFTGLSLSGASHTVQFVQAQGRWVFVSEVTFDGRTGGGVPEPASWALMIAGFCLVGGALRSRRAVTA